MIGALLAVLAIVAFGGRATDKLRVAALESVLERLPEAEARAFYETLRRRMRRIVVMRAIALLALLCIFYVLRRRLVGR